MSDASAHLWVLKSTDMMRVTRVLSPAASGPHVDMRTRWFPVLFIISYVFCSFLSGEENFDLGIVSILADVQHHESIYGGASEFRLKEHARVHFASLLTPMPRSEEQRNTLRLVFVSLGFAGRLLAEAGRITG